MIYEGKVTINASQRVVWDLLLDIDQFSMCMPGIENISKVDEQTFQGVMKATIGPISGEFSFLARTVDTNPPTELRAEVEGSDSLTKSTVTSDVNMCLVALSPNQTELAYRAVVEIKGRLAIIGDMVFRAAGAQVIQEFFKRLKNKVEGAAA